MSYLKTKIVLGLLLAVTLCESNFADSCADSALLSDVTALNVRNPKSIDFSGCSASGVLFINGKWSCKTEFHWGYAFERLVDFSGPGGKRIPAQNCEFRPSTDGSFKVVNGSCPDFSALKFRAANLDFFDLSKLTVGSLKYNLGSRFAVNAECESAGSRSVANSKSVKSGEMKNVSHAPEPARQADSRLFISPVGIAY